jgi:deoxycytidylate deaminase
MVTSEKQSLIEALKKGSVTVTFTKVNTGEIRVMPCTLNPEVLIANGIDTVKVESQSPNNDQIVCWALDKDAWRSFNADTVVSWEVL